MLLNQMFTAHKKMYKRVVLVLCRLIGGVTEIIVLHFFSLESFDVAPTAQPHSALQSAATALMAVAWAELWG